jgi:phosphoribosyl 1,2-cyclic phosphate phosphodiesterase
MLVTILGSGTSQGVPLIGCQCPTCLSVDSRDKRLRVSLMLESENTRIVIDSGPDFRQQLLRERVKTLDAVVFTHEHKDHIAGLDDVRAFNFLQNKNIPVYATSQVQEALKREFAYIFSGNNYPGIPKIDLHTIQDKAFTINDITLNPINVWHYQLPVKVFRVNDFTYITDANKIDEVEKEKIKGSKIIVINALRREEHISHFTFQEAIDFIEEMQPEQAYFTHISHQLGRHEDVEKELPSHIKLAFDGLKFLV